MEILKWEKGYLCFYEPATVCLIVFSSVIFAFLGFAFSLPPLGHLLPSEKEALGPTWIN